MIDEPDKVDDSQMEQWVRDFDSWGVCDQCCMNLFDRTGFAYPKAIEWSSREEEFVKRAGFALMAVLAFHDKKAGDEVVLKFFPAIEKESVDERNYVKKAVNWALRQIGKRSINLNRMAIETAKNIKKIDSRAARWIASDALKELAGEAVQNRLADKKTKS
jgi:3-methyladenine DNA glycosylase AlkD